ncbi:MAG: aminoglycoside phosphotransferase family protein [Maritimibacter sp.]
MTDRTPPAEVPIDEGLARRLLAAQHPDLADLAISTADEGWDNLTMRLGSDMALRLPRRQAAADLIRNEQVWLPRLAPDLPIPVPALLRQGRPTPFYPWHWSVLPWFAGETADRAAPVAEEAPRLAKCLRILHQTAPAEAPHNPFRALPLAARDAATRARIARITARGAGIGEDLHRLWSRAVAAPVPDQRVWIHGDLHARNLLIVEGRIAAVLDWGDMTAGDPSTDLAAFWLLFDGADSRQAGLAEYGAEPTLRLRAMGWAMAMALIHLDTGLTDHPVHARIGAATLSRLSDDLGNISGL